MKVMFIIPSMSGGGAERVISVLANEFINRNVSVKILMTAGSNCVYKMDSAIEIITVGERTGGSMCKRARRIMRMRKVFKQNRDYLLIAFEPNTAFFSCLAKAGLGMKIISSERNDPRAFANKRIRRYAYLHSDKVVFQTEDAMQYFQEEIRCKGRIIANPISKGLPDSYHGERKHTVVAVGRLERQKNHANLLSAFGQFVQRYPEYVLHLYGTGTLEKELYDLAKKLEIDNKVIFEGFHKDVLNEIKDAGMYVLSSDYEGISNSLLEAMGIGLPVISTDCPCGGSRMCVQDGINGLLIPTGNSNALSDAMEKIAGSGKFANDIGRAAFEIRNKFSIESIADQWMELFYELKRDGN